jgi:hypothetical protein
MYKRKVLVISYLTVLLLGCRNEKLKVYALSPSTSWATVVVPRNGNPGVNDTINSKAYIFEGNLPEDTSAIRNRIIAFLDSTENNFINAHRICDFQFYKSSGKLNKDFREAHNDMLSGYNKNRIADVSWVDHKLLGIIFYKEGKPLFEGSNQVGTNSKDSAGQ